jgi:hypothetical protein
MVKIPAMGKRSASTEMTRAIFLLQLCNKAFPQIDRSIPSD